MKKFFILTLAAAALSLTACKNKLEEPVVSLPETEDCGREKIEFSLSDGAAPTRAGFGGSATFIAMRMQSNEKGGTGVKYTRTVATAAKDATNSGTSYSTVSFADSYIRYWDDAHGRKSLLSVFAVAIPNSATDVKGLESKLDKGDATKTWGTSGTNTIAWEVTTTAQTKDASAENTAAIGDGTIDKEDLTYSNNIQAGKTDGVYRWNYTNSEYDPAATGATTHHAGQMLFFQNGMTDGTALTTAVTDAPGHFDKGHLVFNHALSRLTITLVEGAGYDGGSAADFQFTLEQGASAISNITLLGMNVSGTLDLAAGTWGSKATGNIAQIAGSTTAAAGTFVAQVLPDYEIASGSSTNVMKFTIDNNTYFITQDQLYKALDVEANRQAAYGYDGTNSKFTLMQGKNYKFRITVDKKQIDAITATLTAWVDVTAEDFALDNRHVEFSFLDNTTGDECTAGINFYQKTEDLGKIYTDNTYYTTDSKGVAFSGDYVTKGAATLTSMPAPNEGKYKTNWYYEDNKTAYHFRTISDNAKTTLTNGSGTNSYFVMTGAAGATLPDYHWGAPMKTTATLAYDPTSNNGYKANVHEGLTSTASDIKITEMHMLSNLSITLETSTGDDKVILSGATIKLTKLSNTANVDMGTGYITPGAIVNEVTMQTPSDYWQTTDVKTKAFTYAVIPQALNRGAGADDHIGITITTSDNNQYYVIRKLSEILVSDIQKGGAAYTDPDHPKDGEDNYQAITRWYPNHTYNYNIKITKKGIDAITATVAKWVDVTAKDINIDLES